MRNAKMEDLKMNWNRTRFYIKEKISALYDTAGYWSGDGLILDNIEKGEYFLKYYTDKLENAHRVMFTVDTVPCSLQLTLPENTTEIHIFDISNELTGKIRINKTAAEITDPATEEFVKEYAQPKGDYLTAADKDSIVEEIITSLGTPVFGTVDEDNNITLTGALADGTYTLKYENEDGSVTEIGTIEVNESDIIPTFINQIPISTDTDGSIYNSIGYKENTRISASSGSISTMDGVDLTGLIPVRMNDIVRFKNVAFVWATVGSNGGLHFYKADKTTKAVSVNSSIYEENSITDSFDCEYDTDGNLIKFIVKPYGTMTESDIAYVRICASDITTDSIITINEEII